MSCFMSTYEMQPKSNRSCPKKKWCKHNKKLISTSPLSWHCHGYIFVFVQFMWKNQWKASIVQSPGWAKCFPKMSIFVRFNRKICWLFLSDSKHRSMFKASEQKKGNFGIQRQNITQMQTFQAYYDNSKCQTLNFPIVTRIWCR